FPGAFCTVSSCRRKVAVFHTSDTTDAGCANARRKVSRSGWEVKECSDAQFILILFIAVVCLHLGVPRPNLPGPKGIVPFHYNNLGSPNHSTLCNWLRSSHFPRNSPQQFIPLMDNLHFFQTLPYQFLCQIPPPSSRTDFNNYSFQIYQ